MVVLSYSFHVTFCFLSCSLPLHFNSSIVFTHKDPISLSFALVAMPVIFPFLFVIFSFIQINITCRFPYISNSTLLSQHSQPLSHIAQLSKHPQAATSSSCLSLYTPGPWASITINYQVQTGTIHQQSQQSGVNGQFVCYRIITLRLTDVMSSVQFCKPWAAILLQCVYQLEDTDRQLSVRRYRQTVISQKIQTDSYQLEDTDRQFSVRRYRQTVISQKIQTDSYQLEDTDSYQLEGTDRQLSVRRYRQTFISQKIQTVISQKVQTDRQLSVRRYRQTVISQKVQTDRQLSVRRYRQTDSYQLEGTDRQTDSYQLEGTDRQIDISYLHNMQTCNTEETLQFSWNLT